MSFFEAIGGLMRAAINLLSLTFVGSKDGECKLSSSVLLAFYYNPTIGYILLLCTCDITFYL